MPHISFPVPGEWKMPLRLAGLVMAVLAVFVADGVTPLGVLVSALYVPLCLACLWWVGRRLAVLMAGSCSVLMVIGLFLSPPGVSFAWAVFNCSISLASLWLVLWAGMAFLQRAGRLADVLRRSEQEQTAIAVRERTRALQLKRLSELSLALSGEPMEVFDQVVRMIGEQFDVRVVCLSEIVGQELRFKSVYVKGEVFRDAGSCPLAITPCATVETTKDMQIFDRVRERFPEATFLKDHQAFAYCGFPSLDSAGQVVAVTCLLDDHPHEFTEADQAILRLFGQRIAAEIERAQAGDALRKSELRYRTIVEMEPECVKVLDADGHLIEMNAAGLAMLEADTLDQVRGADVCTSVAEEHRAAFNDMVRGVFCGERRMLEFEMVGLKGTRRWMESYAIPIRDAQGRPMQLLAVTRDVTSRKEAEVALCESEARLEFLLSATPAVIYSARASGNYGVTFMSDNVTKLLGYHPAEFFEQSGLWIKGRHPDDREKALAELAHLFEHGAYRAHTLEYRFLHKDGTYRWMRDEVRVVCDAEGNPAELVGCWSDVTERKQAEEALRESEERHALVLKATHDGIWDWYIDTGYDYLSPRWKEILGYRDEELTNEAAAFFDRIHPDDIKRVSQAVAQHLDRQAAYCEEFRLRHKDGGYRWVLSRGEAVRDGAGRPYRMVGSIKDITERKLAELKTEEALQEKEMLLREVHHRVKNNLQLVSSLLYFQAKKARTDDDRTVMRDLQDRIASMILVHETLYRSGDLARIAFGEYVLALAESVSRSYERARGRIDVSVEAQPVTLPVELALPAGLIINELLTNAFKYAFPDAGGGKIRVRVLDGHGGVEIAVEDTGVGLPAGFDFQTSATFGMQLMRGLAAQVGGTITFEREHGTAVRLTVPLPEV